jgi:hypothetical protein
MQCLTHVRQIRKIHIGYCQIGEMSVYIVGIKKINTVCKKTLIRNTIMMFHCMKKHKIKKAGKRV